MKKITLILYLIYPLFIYPKDLPPNRLKIDRFVNELKLELAGLFNDKKIEYVNEFGKAEKVEEYWKSYAFLRGGSPFIREIEYLPIHNILNTFDKKESLNSYLEEYINTVVSSSDFRRKIVIDSGETNILNIDCPFNDKANNLKLVLVSFNQEVKYENNTPINIEFLVGIDVSDSSNYLLKFLYYSEISKEKYNITCNVQDNKNETVSKVGVFLEEQLKDAEFFYNKGEYFNARKKYQSAYELLKINHDISIRKIKIQEITEKIEECTTKITSNKKQIIEKLFINGKFKDVKRELSKIKSSEIINSEWFKNISKKTKENIEKNANKKLLNLADYNFKTNNYKKALIAYQELTKLRFLDQSYITSQIQKCKEADPNFVQNQLNKADKIGQESKKNWHKAFNTYYKYERSGRLRADQFYFMMVMMLDSNHSRVGKPMGFTRRKMNMLSLKYFYEAKDRGYNVSFAENHIFSERAMKKHRK